MGSTMGWQWRTGSETVDGSFCIMSADMHMRWLYETVKDEEAAVQFLRKKGLLHSERRCSSCGQMMRHRRGGWTWRCFKRSCRKEISLRNGTWFDGSRHGMKFHKAVEIIYWWNRELTSMKVCVRDLNVNRITASRWCRYLRQVAADALALTTVQLGGPGMTVELDESFFSRSKYNRGRKYSPAWLFGAVCQGNTEVHIEPVYAFVYGCLHSAR